MRQPRTNPDLQGEDGTQEDGLKRIPRWFLDFPGNTSPRTCQNLRFLSFLPPLVRNCTVWHGKWIPPFASHSIIRWTDSNVSSALALLRQQLRIRWKHQTLRRRESSI